MPLKIRGDGQLRDFARTFIAEHRLTHVELVDRLEDRSLADLVRGARVLVVASEGYYETFGMVVIEAYAQGVPVLAARSGVVTELVDEGKTGLLFEAGNPTDLASKMEWLWNHPAETEVMGRQAFDTYRDRYTPDRCYEMLMQVYGRVIDARAER
jgi:glycosyltransferase involved in cell wall biosynthesis